MKIEAKDVRLVPVGDLKPNPKNRNNHPAEQIDRLCEIIKYQGFRQPVVVSNRSGFVVAGHGRLMAAKKLELETVPVLFQDFESEDQEYAFGVSDNAIASWAELDLSGINQDALDFGADFNIDMLGIGNFKVEETEKTSNESGTDGGSTYREQYAVLVVCENSTQQEEVFYRLMGEGLNCRVVVT